MPRGGARGGFGSTSRGSRPRPGTARIAGVELEIDYDIDPSTPSIKPGELFPERKLRAAAPLSEVEKAQLSAASALRSQIHEGPFFTVLDASVRARKEAVHGSSTVVIADPFENGVEMYGMRYRQGKRKAPALEEREYVLKYFPRELWGVLDSRYANSGVGMRKRMKVDLEKTKAKLDALPDDGGEKFVDDEGGGSDEEPPEAGLVDDDFEEDDDDMAGDYNAEQYFDDGGDDAGDDYDGGDGGGDDGMY